MIAMGVLVLAGLVSLATAPADQPLSKDDITLLLLGIASATPNLNVPKVMVVLPV